MEFNENKPIYLQLAEQIMDEVERPGFEPESRLLSVREFAAKSGVNPNTVMRTYTWLQQEKIIYNKRGVGYFFEPFAQTRVLMKRRDNFYQKEIPKFIERMFALNVDLITFERIYQKYMNERIYGK